MYLDAKNMKNPISRNTKQFATIFIPLLIEIVNGNA
jgi:hypothetical protein